MALIKFTGFNKLERQLKEKINKALLDKALLDAVGTALVKEVRGNARTSGSRTGEKFAPLKKSTKKSRKQIAKYNDVDASYREGKSNMTLTGTTLKAITFETANKKPLISIIAPGNHPGYAKKDGASTGQVPFADILRWNHEKRKVMAINKKGKIVDTIRNIVRRHLRRLLK